jgi:hypothetical protein
MDVKPVREAPPEVGPATEGPAWLERAAERKRGPWKSRFPRGAVRAGDASFEQQEKCGGAD